MTKKEVLELLDEAAAALRDEATTPFIGRRVDREEYLYEVAAQLEAAKSTIRTWKMKSPLDKKP